MNQKYAIVVSKKDPAGLNIKEQLLQLYPFEETSEMFEKEPVYRLENVKIYTAEIESIYCENIDQNIDADIIIFATKHRSSAGKNSLSVHIPGNWEKAEMGGKDRKLCIAPASLLKEIFLELNKNGQNSGFEITLECTHHGPETSKPTIFIEIGSNLEAWENKEAGITIAKTIMNVLTREIKDYETYFAMGSIHYPDIFNKILLRTNIAIGHICPKYNLKNLDEEMVKQAIEKTKEKISFVLLDWKGLGEEKSRIVKILEGLGLLYKRAQELLKDKIL